MIGVFSQMVGWLGHPMKVIYWQNLFHRMYEALAYTEEIAMLDMKTQKKIRDTINDNDNSYVESLRDEAFLELTRLKNIDRNKGLNALERKELDVNIEIITRAEMKLHGQDA